MGETEILLEGAYGGGDFMVVARGTGANAHTQVTFEPFLPQLFEGVQVDTDEINGVANQPFLTGDGTVNFTLACRPRSRPSTTRWATTRWRPTARSATSTCCLPTPTIRARRPSTSARRATARRSASS